MIEERISRFYVVKCKNKRCDMVSVFNTREEAEEAENKYWKPRNGLCSLCYEHLKKLEVKEDPEYYQHFDSDC